MIASNMYLVADPALFVCNPFFPINKTTVSQNELKEDCMSSSDSK